MYLQLGKRKIPGPGTGSRVLPRLYCSKGHDRIRIRLSRYFFENLHSLNPSGLARHSLLLRVVSAGCRISYD
jgi:hypothetical protein